ncbi:MAG: chemotaxis protein CheR [Candidatus Raymondbacteria bacterium RifOxyA12_full_50_37]|uniref:protein-glutamate O-methyltransferase n=1 Tax=Candidatus Raymondbacteria bacterium RIFOXYD12_FULL_49_13 TaxID=1817890 RepID=A0A1F7FL71_UNCRA|nr:MAG: chemotaxis protein CheR [Candidatus Raymondbacteria bacterium RifOxyA12_full_50_37]OGJ86123.1 MAG: chemotaxis protein CheR [Candidatus Raymondbacteria bacterium RIFOXYA2_FULL_49_16]OGK07410.1 MAG: chemotaxis protein CheR [Candidatus Raymondbacteria bacterium RIFOXYD12_FULL_49_13]OGK07549.1 MAG: chemotaxis protein CheR [Candidatus Raymondbacteria bacterium RifOxyC12_full_50_8]OGP40433.1 MAG: chemotaxis protein CheR [Candidatus Raymondbacteria bacterium RIFOXYB2_FULL_49_35]
MKKKKQRFPPVRSEKIVKPGIPEPGSKTKQANTGFPIVGIGASAGGLAAIESFFSAIPQGAPMDMAFVVVQHLDPDHKSILVDLVKKYTTMPVTIVEDAMEVRPNCVYIIPPNQDMAFHTGKLHLLEPETPHGLRLPIDFFFRSLAQDQRERAICVVLSGTGTDGSAGLKAIKGEGGMAMVQTPESAAYDGMPRNAIATGLADYVLPPEKMPEQLILYGQRTFNRHAPGLRAQSPDSSDVLHKVFLMLRDQTGHDFSLYKRNTINRRIERRMAVTQISRPEDYIRFLRENKAEVDILFRELLIGVTSFFRDPEAFESLRKNVIQGLLKKPAAGGVRIWVPGCSTGEEAYSIAMLIREHLDNSKQNFPAQIFATDIDAEAIEKARAGVFSDSIAADVSPERIARFFTRTNTSYRIGKRIRDLVVFAKQDVLKDPPFSKVDLISCRNLLIYFDVEAQKKLLPLFHYALNPDGHLFLGNSESVGELTTMFASVDKKWKIFARKTITLYRPATIPILPPPGMETRNGKTSPIAIPVQPATHRQLAEQTMLDTYVPASVLVNMNLDVLFIHGHTGEYLEPATGEATLNLLKLARPGLRAELAAATRKALSSRTPARHNNIRIATNGKTSLINLVVKPVIGPKGSQGMLMVIFEETAKPAAKEAGRTMLKAAKKSGQNQRLVALELEVQAKGEYLQATIEELETANEELKSTNEELQSSNEELQSTNEEMETSKEELQSVNEELITVNNELQKKIEELSRSNNDMNNLMAGTNIGTLFVDLNLRIQRFTPATTHIINLIQTDIGRPISDIVSRLDGYDSLVQDARAVLDTLVPKEAEVLTKEGQWYQMRIQPYRTLENVIEGVVITFVKIIERKK